MGQFTDQEDEPGDQGLGGGAGALLFNGHRASVSKNDNVLNIVVTVTDRCEYLMPLNYTLTKKWLKGSTVYYVLPFQNEISPKQAASRTQPGCASPEGSALRSEQTSPRVGGES